MYFPSLLGVNIGHHTSQVKTYFELFETNYELENLRRKKRCLFESMKDIRNGAYNLLENDIRAKIIPIQDDEKSREQVKRKNAIMQQNSKKIEVKINLFKSIVRDMPHTIASIKEYKPLYDFNNACRQMNEECLNWRKENS